MEKIKSILNPGKATEDEILYGSGRVDDPVHSGNPGRLAGEGSHFNDARDAKDNTNVGNTTAAPATSASGATGPGHAAATFGTSDVDGSRTLGETEPGYTSTKSSTMPGSFPAQSNSPYSSQPVDSRLDGPAGHSLSKNDGTTAQGDDQHHYGRDAAAVGTAGVLGEGIHHHRENEKGPLGDGSSTTAGLGPSTNINESARTANPVVGGPHATSTANQLDPNYNQNAAPIENARHHSESGGGGRSADEAHGRSDHLGRDAAIGAGGIGIAAHEHRKHEHEREAGLGSNVATTRDGVDSGIGTHGLDKRHDDPARLNESGNESVTVPTSGSYGTGAGHGYNDKDASKDHHYGRDAAAAGVVGGGAYEAEKHHKHDKDLTAAEREEKRELKHERMEERRHHGDKHDPKDHHYGRDAAAAGVVGGGAYEAEKHHKHDKDLTAAEREEKRELKHEKKEEKKHHGDKHDPTDHHYGRDAAAAGVVGGGAYEAEKHHKHDKDLTAAEREEKRELKHEKKEERKHHGRDAVVGGTAYEAEKHHGHPHTRATEAPDTSKPLPLAPGNHGLGTGPGTQNLLDQNQRDVTSHHGQEAAAGAGGVALAGHEHRKHEKDRPLDDSTTATGTGANNQHHLGRDAALGLGGVGVAEHEHRKHEKERDINEQDNSGTHKSGGLLSKLGLKSDKSATGTYDNTPDSSLKTHHHEKEAAVGAGSVGVAEHEHRKHDNERSLGTTNPGEKFYLGHDAALGGAAGTAGYEHEREQDVAGQDTSTPQKSGGLLSKLGLRSDKSATGTQANDNTTDPNAHSHHRGQEAALGAGSVGIAEHEHRKHEKEHPLDDSTNITGTKHQHHPGRDAALGVGGVGVAEHEHRKHEKERDVAGQDTSTPQKSGGLLSKLGLRSDKSATGTQANDNTTDPNVHSHHRGQEAALGAGSVGVAEHEHRKHEKERPLDDNTTGNDRPHHLGRDAAVGAGGVGLAEHEHRKHEKERGINEQDTSAPQKSGGLLNKLGLNPDKSAVGTQAYVNTTDPNIHSHHRGQEASLGAGSAGIAELEHRKHEKERAGQDTSTPQKSGGLLNKLGLNPDKSAVGTQAYVNTTDPNVHSHHRGQEAALGAGSVGVAEHEHRKHEKERPLDDNTTGNDRPHHLGRDAAVGAGGVGLAEHEHRKHESERGTNDYDNTTGATGPHQPGGLLSKLGHKTYPEHSTGPTSQDRQDLGRDTAVGAGGVGLAEQEHLKHEREHGLKDNENTQAAGSQHHYGRDAAIGVGGAGIAEHEHKKHEKERNVNESDNVSSTPKSGGLLSKLGLRSDKTTAGSRDVDTTDPNQDRHHLGRDAALGAGGVGLAEHEHRKHEHERVQERGNVNTGVGGAHIPGTGPSRNVLQKDPPAGHPAAAGAVRSEANTDQDGNLVQGQNDGVEGVGAGIGTTTGTDAYSSTGTGAYSNTGSGVGARDPGTY